MLEVVCINYYAFRRADKKFKQCLEILSNAVKTKSTAEKSRLSNRYYQEAYEIFSTIFDANVSSSIDWSKYIKDRFNQNIKAGEQVKKVHVNTAIEDIAKQSGFPLQDAYNVLSEFVHPNAGSKMLIIKTKQSRYPLMDALTIGDNKENSEAALFYIDHVAESMFYTWTLALTLFHRGQKLISVLDELVPSGSSRNVH
jgi:argininosuccinate lyase